MRSKSLFAGIVAMAFLSSHLTADDANKEVPKVLSFKMKSLDGDPIELSKYEGKVVVFVNVASKCGYTPQYTGLQKLFEEYSDKGLVVVGVPCNQFGGQEAGSNKEIREFCSSKYKVTFDMLDKVNVNDNSTANESACDLYKYLTQQDVKPAGKGPIKWNFEKYVVDRKGNVVAHFTSKTAPDSAELKSVIEKALKD